MKIAFIARSTLYDAPGGDTIQLLETARHLEFLGAQVSVCLTTDPIDYAAYDLFHFSNLTRPADILFHIARFRQPFTLSPLLVDYSEYDRQHRKGLSGLLLRHIPAGMNEYVKTVFRWLLKKDALRSKDYLWKGQNKSIRQVLERAAWLLPNSESELREMQERYSVVNQYSIVPNGIDTQLFHPGEAKRDDTLVICAARIEGIKNQLNLIRALNNTRFTLLLIGSPATNQLKYHAACRAIAAPNIHFHQHVPQPELIRYYNTARVHVLPSWFETCGLSSLEAAAMGCNVVITDKGYARDYFGDDAFYCDPAAPASIHAAVERAAQRPCSESLQQRIRSDYTWKQAAAITFNAFRKIIRE